jgi:hypothetical protein
MDKEELSETLREAAKALEEEIETPEERKEKRAYRLSLAKFIFGAIAVGTAGLTIGWLTWLAYFPHCIQMLNALPVCK